VNGFTAGCRYRIRNFALNAYMEAMDKTPLSEQVAKLERKRLAAEDGAKAIQEIAARAIAVRENMVRLRALRLSKEAQAVRIAPANQLTKAKPNKLAG
jgi:hypothetical protein